MNPASLMLNKIHDVVQNSGLHFVINRTPFSSYITIRQKFVSNHETKMLDNLSEDALIKQLNQMKLTVQELQSEKGMLEEACVIKDEELQTLQHISDQKLLNLHRFSEKLEAENNSLKNDLSNLNHQINDLKAGASKSNKLLKSSEKEIHNLSRNIDNMQDSIMNLKTDKVKLRDGKAKAEAELKKLEKKVAKNSKIKLVNSDTQTNDEELSLPLSTIPSLSEVLTCSKSPASDFNSASQYEDSFVEFDKRVIDEEPIVYETEETVASNIPVHNLYETLARETDDEDVEHGDENPSSLATTSHMDTTCSLKTTTSQNPSSSSLDTTTTSLVASSSSDSPCSLKTTTSQHPSSSTLDTTTTSLVAYCSSDTSCSLANNDEEREMLKAVNKMVEDMIRKCESY